MIQVKHLGKKDYKTTTWAGGTTTEILLYPENGDYGERDFQLRISTATVELAESDFSLLEGFHRHLTLLEGKISVEHDNSTPMELVPFQIWEFDGGKPTTSFGICRDFNLIHSPLWTGQLVPIHEETHFNDKNDNIFVVYGTENGLEITVNYNDRKETVLLNKEESLVLTNPEGEVFSLSTRQLNTEDAKPFALAVMGRHTQN